MVSKEIVRCERLSWDLVPFDALVAGSTSRRIAKPGYGAAHVVFHDFSGLLSNSRSGMAPVTPLGFWLPARVFPRHGWSPSPASSPLDVSGHAAGCRVCRLQGLVPRVSPLPPTGVGARSLPGIPLLQGLVPSPPHLDGHRPRGRPSPCDPPPAFLRQPSRWRLAPPPVPVGCVALGVFATLRPDGLLRPSSLVEFSP